jgi:hypothetical protein
MKPLQLAQAAGHDESMCMNHRDPLEVCKLKENGQDGDLEIWAKHNLENYALTSHSSNSKTFV